MDALEELLAKAKAGLLFADEDSSRKYEDTKFNICVDASEPAAMGGLEELLAKAQAGLFTCEDNAPSSSAAAGLRGCGEAIAVAVLEAPTQDSVTSSAGAATPIPATERLAAEGIRVVYITDTVAAHNAVCELLTATTPLGFDIETAKLPEFAAHPLAGREPDLSRIRLAQFYGAGSSEVYVFDVGVLDLDCLRPLWDRRLVAHNAVFELKHLLHAGVLARTVGCTMLQANALGGVLPKLSALAERLLGWDMSKELQGSDWNATTLSADQIAYAALDAVAVQRIATIQAEQLVSRKLTKPYKLMRDAQLTIARLELNGCYFDVIAHMALLRTWETCKADAESALRVLLGPGVSPSSGPQISAWLEAHLDAAVLQGWPRTGTGLLQTDADTLARYPDHPLVKPLLAWKEAAKLVGTYGTGYTSHINPATGRIHASFRLGGTATGRLSCSKPNIQNPPRDPAFRALFSAPPGRTLVVADYGQIELRVAALVAGDQAMLEAYASGVDLHRKTAAAVTGVPLEAVSKAQRQTAKAVNFGLLYGQGPRGLALYAASSYGVRMSEGEARQARKAFFEAYPGLAAWQRTTGRIAARTKQSKTPAGRVRDFTLENRGYRYTEALNTPIQGGAAEVMLAALAALERNLKGLDAQLVNVVHDELVLEVAEADAPAVKAAVEAAMTEGMLAIFPGASTVGLVEAHIGPNWAAAKG